MQKSIVEDRRSYLVSLMGLALDVDFVCWSSGLQGSIGSPDLFCRGEANPMRFYNAHLENLAQQLRRNPSQMLTCAKYLHDEAVHGGVVAGDLNTIQPFDDTLHLESGLGDAWSKFGDKADGGNTWVRLSSSRFEPNH